MSEELILVDQDDRAIGVSEKLRAHQVGLLHRAFSIFVFNSTGELILQRRAFNKYHSAGLWTNTCCSHPRPRETIKEAAHRRLMEEMGFDCELQEVFSFSYCHKFADGLVENEFDHVLIGTFDGKPELDNTEVAEFKISNLDEIMENIKNCPEAYTYWFKLCFSRIKDLKQASSVSI